MPQATRLNQSNDCAPDKTTGIDTQGRLKGFFATFDG
jgi:hypothetical protein